VQIPEYFHTFLHIFTFVVFDGKGIESNIDCKIKDLPSKPGWRNWQTQRTQKTLGICGAIRLSRNSFQELSSETLVRNCQSWFLSRGSNFDDLQP
jgi:hypothetical protein